MLSSLLQYKVGISRQDIESLFQRWDTGRTGYVSKNRWVKEIAAVEERAVKHLAIFRKEMERDVESTITIAAALMYHRMTPAEGYDALDVDKIGKV